MGFDPQVGQQIDIADLAFRFVGNPSAPDIPYGQEGRAAIVYKLESGKELYALKVFKARYRVPSMVSLSSKLEPYASRPGLTVCRRSVLTSRNNSLLLRQYPDLSYAVLMPWIIGPTWLDILSNRDPITTEQSHHLARSFANILSEMEQQGIAHCDLSSSNIILSMFTKAQESAGSSTDFELVDVEQIYAQDLKEPEFIPRGTEGYAHHTIREGKIWNALADRFSGAILLAEMLGCCDPVICQTAWGDSYFKQGELQKPGQRFDQLLASIQRNWGNEVSQLLSRAWTSDLLADCPTFDEWLLAIPEQIAEQPLVSNSADWQEEPSEQAEINSESILITNHALEINEQTNWLVDSSLASVDNRPKPMQLDQFPDERQELVRGKIEGYSEKIVTSLDRPKSIEKKYYPYYFFGAFLIIVIAFVLSSSIMGSGREIPQLVDTPTQNQPTPKKLFQSPTPNSTVTPTVETQPTLTQAPSTTPTLGLENLTMAFSKSNINKITNILTLGKSTDNAFPSWNNHGVFFSKNNRFVGQIYSTSNYDSTVGQVFDIKERKMVKEFGGVERLAFSPNETKLASIASGRIKIEDIASISNPQIMPFGNRFVDFVTDESILVDYGGYIAILNIQTQKQEKAFVSFGESQKISTTNDHRIIATEGWNGAAVNQLQVWDSVENKRLYQAPIDYNSDFVFTSNDMFLVVASDQRIDLVDLSTGKVSSSFNIDQKNLRGNSYSYQDMQIVMSPDQSLLILTLGDSQVTFYDFASHSLIKTLTFHNIVTGMELSSDGKLLAIASKGLLYLYGIGN